ncbi:MAG: iron dicitrate transport regulator FecR [Rubripirellula sp.]
MPEPMPPIDDELEELLEAVANRDLTQDDRERLAERLAMDSDARAAFIESTALEAMLSHEFPASLPQVASSALELPEQNQSSNSVHPMLREASRTNPLLLLLSAVAASILLAVVFLPIRNKSNPVATIASSENAAWESMLPTKPGSELAPGVLELKSGIATIRFSSGAVVTLEAPAQFEVISDMRGKLIDGAAVINVPQHAIGFVIESPDGYAIDYGTSFAVHVDRKAQRSDFELIEGEIAVHHSVTGKEVRLTDPNDAVSVRENSLIKIDREQSSGWQQPPGRVLRLGTNGRSTSVLPNNKRRKFLDPEVLSVKTTENGKWDYRSFFAFDLSAMDASRIRTARLRLNLVPSRRGFASRLPVVNRFGVYGLTNPAKSNWVIESTWEDAPSQEDCDLLGTFEVLRSQQRGTFGIANEKLVRFLQENRGRSVTILLVRETSQIEGQGPGLTHLFASDNHPEAVGPLLELTTERNQELKVGMIK